MSAKDSKDKFSRVVRFAQAEADQVLWQAIEKNLNETSQSNFSELCKQALQQYLSLPSDAAPVSSAGSVDAATDLAPEVSTLQRQVVALQKQIRALQLQVSKLEGAIGMQQSLSWSKLEQQLVQLEQRMTQQTSQLTDRLTQLELGHQDDNSMVETVASNAGASNSGISNAMEMDPLLSRLVPLLEDF